MKAIFFLYTPVNRIYDEKQGIYVLFIKHPLVEYILKTKNLCFSFKHLSVEYIKKINQTLIKK